MSLELFLQNGKEKTCKKSIDFVIEWYSDYVSYFILEYLYLHKDDEKEEKKMHQEKVKYLADLDKSIDSLVYIRNTMPWSVKQWFIDFITVEQYNNFAYAYQCYTGKPL